MNGRLFFERYHRVIAVSERLYALTPQVLTDLVYTLTINEKIRVLLRYLDLKTSSESIAENVYIAENVVIKNTHNLKIGKNCSLHEFGYIDAAGGIVIGDNVSIAHNCSLVSFDHTWKDCDLPIKYNPTKSEAIHIGNDVWIGCGVRILAGVVIEERVVVAAGSVVRGRLEQGHIYAGVPAKKLKKI